nr:hybrid sensor histidine kinase/response regulator [Pseudohongiella sp.]
KLPEFIDQMVQMFRDMAANKQIDFSCHIHNKLPEVVTTDSKRLYQILVNLLSNAIKYTPRGSVEFHVRYRNQVAEFSVVDTGIGISEKDLKRILDPFERVRGPDVPNVPGTGLGLTIVRLLSEIMGGDLDIVSTPGKGSCFTVSLMMSRVTEHSIQTPVPHQIKGYRGPRLTVMVVDDDPIHRGLMSELLPPLGFTVLESPDAQDCLETIKEARPDILLLDVSMPGLSGLELIKQLREMGHRQPAIMISADAQEHHRSVQDTAHHNAYLVKPINHQRLLETIGDLLSIDWIVDRPGSETPMLEKDEPPTDLTTIADHELVRELITCAELGYKRGVQNKMDELARHELINETSRKSLKKLLDGMQFAQIARSFTATKKPKPTPDDQMSATEK